MIVYNIQGMIVFCASFLSSLGLKYFFPHVYVGNEIFFWSIPLAVFGYVSELLALRPRVFFIPAHIAGGLATAFGIFVRFGPAKFWLSVAVFVFILWILKAVEEFRAWQIAQRALSKYDQERPKAEDVAEIELKNMLFHNRWLPATNKLIEHDICVIKYLISDCSKQMSAPEQEILGKVLNVFEARKDLIRWRWLLRYISPLKNTLAAHSGKRSLGRYLA